MAKKRDREVNLSDKFSSLIHAKPAFFDEDEEDLTKIDDIVPNDRNSDGSADELDLVQFRKLNIEFLDAEDSKYSGKKSSRVEQAKAFGSDSSDVEESTDENVDQTPFSKDDESEIEDDESVRSDVGEGSPEPAGSPSEPGKICGLLNDEILQKSTEDIKKGTAIRNQLLIWDLLLECRMKFQKCLTSANQLPKFDKLEKFTALGGKDLQELLSTSQDSMKHLLNSFLNLQDALLKSNDDYKKCAHKHNLTSDEEDYEDQDNEKKRIKLSDLSSEIESRHREMETYRNETIQKWNEKTRIAHLNSKNFNAFEQSTLKQIEHVLLDKQRLIKKTQVKRSNYQILGQSDDEGDESPPKKQIKIDNAENPPDCLEKKTEKKICKEIFDDDDFYHQLLSEYIKRKSGDVSDPVTLSKQWIQLEKIRSKMKKKVDTRATKGRKIRYVVHQKLVNFMMPIDNVMYNEGSRIELFNSIFGKNETS